MDFDPRDFATGNVRAVEMYGLTRTKSARTSASRTSGTESSICIASASDSHEGPSNAPGRSLLDPEDISWVNSRRAPDCDVRCQQRNGDNADDGNKQPRYILRSLHGDHRLDGAERDDGGPDAERPTDQAQHSALAQNQANRLPFRRSQDPSNADLRSPMSDGGDEQSRQANHD